MTQTGPRHARSTEPDTAPTRPTTGDGDTAPEPAGRTSAREGAPPDWTGRTVRSSDGARLGRLAEVRPGGAGGWGVVRSTLGRRRLVPLGGAATDDRGALTVPVDRAAFRSAPRADRGTDLADPAATAALDRHYTGRGVLADARARQQERFGGAKVGAAFFGWLVAVGLTVPLAAVVVGVLSASGAETSAGGAGLTAAIATVAVLVVAYYAGGYVAGRLARFDGARNGALAWLVGVLATVVAVVVTAVVGERYDLAAQVRLPALPLTAEQLTVGGLLTLAAVLVGTLVAAVLGGKAGERFHRKVDRVATDSV